MDKGEVLDQAQERQHERVSMSVTSLAAAVTGEVEREAQGHQKRGRDQRKSKQEKRLFNLAITHFSQASVE